MSVVSSRRNSTTSTIPSSPTSSQPPTPTIKIAPASPIMIGNLRQRKPGSLTANATQRKVNPIRRCQSMRSNARNGGSNSSSNGSITSQGSLCSRRVSSHPHSLEGGAKFDNDFVKYYQYKTNKCDPLSLLNIVIVDEEDDQFELQRGRKLRFDAENSLNSSFYR